MYKPKILNVSETKRAQLFVRYKRLDAVMESKGSLSRFINAVDSHIEPLIDLRNALTQAGNHSLQGITAELEKPKAAARVELEKIKADVEKQAATIEQQAKDFEAKTFEFTDEMRKDFDLFMAMPAEQRAAAKDAVLAGKHDRLGLALVAAPAWATENVLTTHAREILRGRLLPKDEAAAILRRAEAHRATLDHIGDVIHEIDTM